MERFKPSTDVASACSDVIRWVRSIYDDDCVLVGGAVRDLFLGTKPKDWDVYFLRRSANDLHLRAQWRKVSENMNKPFRRHKALIAEVMSPFGNVQVFSSDKHSAEEIVAECDWDVSAFSFDGRVFMGENHLVNIGEGKKLVLLKVTNPITTLARGFDFSKRFNMIFDTKDIVSLCDAVSSGKFRKPRPKQRKKRYF